MYEIRIYVYITPVVTFWVEKLRTATIALSIAGVDITESFFKEKNINA